MKNAVHLHTIEKSWSAGMSGRSASTRNPTVRDRLLNNNSGRIRETATGVWALPALQLLSAAQRRGYLLYPKCGQTPYSLSNITVATIHTCATLCHRKDPPTSRYRKAETSTRLSVGARRVHRQYQARGVIDETIAAALKSSGTVAKFPTPLVCHVVGKPSWPAYLNHQLSGAFRQSRQYLCLSCHGSCCCHLPFIYTCDEKTNGGEVSAEAPARSSSADCYDKKATAMRSSHCGSELNAKFGKKTYCARTKCNRA